MSVATRVPALLLSVALGLLLAGCAAPLLAPERDAPEIDRAEPSPLVQSAFRVRAERDAPLAADEGWAAATNAPARVAADRPFRLRFELELAEGASIAPGPLRVQARRNEGAFETLRLRDFPYPDELSTPRVSLVRVEDWGEGRATSDLLEVSRHPFAAGEAFSDLVRYDRRGDALEGRHQSRAWPPAEWKGEALQGEWEWPLVIRRYADGPLTNEEGDVFEFRMIDAEGRPIEGATRARVTLDLVEGWLGGTYVETPGVLGPWQASTGALYFPMEPAETDNVLMMTKSTDNGRRWREIDGAKRPLTDDLEGFASTHRDGRIYLLHQVSKATYLHAFDTEDAASGEGWAIRDELVARHREPEVQVAALVARRDGSLVAFYGDARGLVFRTRAPRGGWGEERRVESARGQLASGVMALVDAEDVVHIAYTAGDERERRAWYRTLSPEGALGEPLLVAEGLAASEEDFGAIAPLGLLPGGEVVVAYRRAEGALVARRVGPKRAAGEEETISTRPVVQCGADSDQVAADLVVHEGVVHVLFVDEESGDIFHARSEATGGFSAPSRVVAGVEAQWLRGRVVRGPAGEALYGFVYDAGSDGGSGMNRYAALPLDGKAPRR